MFPKVTLILGGASSGKSNYAEALVKHAGKPTVYLATAQADDSEMTDRIARHKQSRGTEWQTVEVPLKVADALGNLPAGRAVLLDCATMWLTNQMIADNDLAAAAAGLLAAIVARASPVVVVSNEVGLGGVSDNALARKFGQVQGALNITLAAQADLVVSVTAGLPTVLKGTMPR